MLPFAEFLDWSTFSIVVPEDRYQTLPALLRGVSEQRWLELKGNGTQVYETVFASTERFLDFALECVRRRVYRYPFSQQRVVS